MKLHLTKFKYFSLALFIVSFTAIALGVITMTGPSISTWGTNELFTAASPDTIVKPPLAAPDTAFGNILQRAEAMFRANKLEVCISEYEKAQKLKPGDKAVNSRIIQLKSMLAEYNRKKVDFDASMANGNAAFQKKDYLNAKAYYQIALNVLPNDSVAKERLKKTMELVRSQKAQNTLFDVAVANADRLFQAGEFDKASEEYENAARILPGEQYPKQKINEIIKIKVDMQLNDGLYAEAIKNADTYYNAKNWQPALQEYQAASKIKPAEKYPKDRITELTTLIAAQRTKDEAYIKLIASADQYFTAKSYVVARKDYVSASKIKPDQSYPKSKIAEIDLLLTQGAKTQKDYEQYISFADSFYISKNFLSARDYYRLALGVKPNESYPKEMLEKVKPLVAGQEAGEIARDESYKSAITIADREFSVQNYDQSKNEYQRALGIKPAEAYPKERIAAIEKIFADKQQAALMSASAKQKALDNEYAALVASGEKLFKTKSWDQAKSTYQKALGLKPDEALPKRRIASIDSIGEALLARGKKLEDDYLAAIKKGDSLLGLNSYAEAKTAFTQATTLKPSEKYPKDKLLIINTALADLSKQQALDKQYLTTITSADKLFAAKSYSEAKLQYTAALTLKPGEAYPTSKLTEISTILEGASKQKTLDAEYAGLLASGEKLFKAKTWEQAKSEYQKALAIKPAETLPQKRIASIDSIVEVLLKQKSIEEQYTGIITSADKLLALKTYDQAKAEYQKALALKPAETYPKTKIQEIEKQLAELARLKKLDEDYASTIKKGDSLLGKTEYAQAKTVFTEAAALKPAETYPKEKLTIINAALADLVKQQAIDKQYLAAVTSADKLLAAKSYTEAKNQYTAALTIKPAEAYPKTKIAEIDQAIEEIAKQKALDSEYAGLLASGEKLFKAKTWEQAKSEYQKALAIKPTETLPQKRIASIDSIGAAEIARLKKLDEEYASAVKKGDSLMGKSEYALAKTVFTEAAALKPAENYPKEKLALITTALVDLAKQQALDKQYLAAISSADKLLAAKSYSDAKVQYAAASALKPSEAYSKTKIAEIDKTLEDIAKQKALDAEYAGLLATGEKLFKAKTWEQAKSEYQKALALKPAEVLPKQRISSIDSIADVILKQKNLDEQYAALITGADKLFASRTYEQAKAEYQKAGALKPAEEYPKAQIREIDKQLAEIARIKKLEDDYKLAVKKGDSLLVLKQYTQARTPFTEAGTLKPAEAYPKEKLAQITKALEDLAKQKDLDDRYQTVITSADKLLAVKSYNEAKTQYSSALTLKPAETYPKSKIAEIDKTIADSIQKQKVFEAQYAGIIGNADKLLLAKNYSLAKPEYEKASGMKPAEEYPKTKISEIEKALADIAARKTRDSAYAAVIASADKLLLAKSYDDAKSEYQKAFQFKADDLYTKTKISEIDRAVADIARQKANVESRYKASIARADQLLASRSFEQAKAEYNVAIGVKAGEQYPKDKIREIDQVIAELKVKEDAYRASVAKADQMLLEKKYEDARTEYENALTIKPNDQYAKNKVDEINKKLVELQGKKKTFDDLVLKGDNAFGSRDLGKAREYFQQASALFPEEKYPKDRLDRVNAVIDSLYRANKGRYDKAIAEGDKYYNGFEFDKAIDAYTDASAFLPMENYPKDMIARIRRTIAENAIADVLNAAVTITSNDEKKFKFTPVNIASRKDNFIYIKIKNLSNKPFNVLLRYGKDNQPSGGVVIRNLSTDGRVNERLISVREQDVWYRVDNDYISLYPQGGDIEVTFIQVSKAR